VRLGRGQFAVGLAFSALFLWIAFRRIVFADLALSLRGADYRWLVAYPILATILNWLRGGIWRLLLEKRVGRGAAFWAYAVGFLVNNVLPFRVGEAARIGLLARRSGLPIVEVGTAAGLERIFDLVFVLAIVIVSVPFASGGGGVQAAALTMGGAATVAIVGLVCVIAFRHRLTRIVKAIAVAVVPRQAPALVMRWGEMMNGLAVMRSPRLACTAVGGSSVVWMLTIVAQWTVLRAFQPEATLLHAALLVGLVSLAAAIPAAPGAIGTYQWVAQQALVLPFPLLYTPSRALAAALVSHAASYVFSSALGAAGLWYFGVSLVTVKRMDGARADIEQPPPTVRSLSITE
jgi:glycosyltransferase 2 family protein